MMETDLYFGQSKPDGTIITENEWTHFKETEIAKAFKEGTTILPGTGTWYDTASNKLISEPTYVVVYFYKHSGSVSKRIDSLRSLYKTLFNQQSILRVDKKVKAVF
jgi:hypothetical protein